MINNIDIGEEIPEALVKALNNIEKSKFQDLAKALKNKNNDSIAEALARIIAGNNGSEQNIKNKIHGKLESISDPCENFGKFLDALKNAWNELNKDKNIKVNKKFSFLLDTCYNESRGKQLAEGLKKLNNLSNKKDNCKAVALLAAAYAVMLAKESSIEYLEWLPLLARAAAKSKETGNERTYIPVCPSRGDLAAVLYYLLLCCQS